jgi:hypothetical protein
MQLRHKVLFGDGDQTITQIPIGTRPPSGENPDPELDTFKDPEPVLVSQCSGPGFDGPSD